VVLNRSSLDKLSTMAHPSRLSTPRDGAAHRAPDVC
jgi:hypothetical protein